MPAEPIRVRGLKELSRSLKQTNDELPKALRVALNGVADVVVATARGSVPRRSGRAAASIKPKSTRTAVRVGEGSRAAPYMPWLDYGGKVGRKRSVDRPFRKEGRYLYPAYRKHRDEIPDMLSKAFREVAARAGLGVS